MAQSAAGWQGYFLQAAALQLQHQYHKQDKLDTNED